MRRYGSGFADRLHEMFAAADLPFSTEIERVPNSMRALMLSERARDLGLLEPLHARLFDAYWARGRDIGEERVLLEEAAAVGLDADVARAALDDAELRRRVGAATDAAVQLGASGVPAWVIDQRVMVPGAQPHEVFDSVMAQLGHAPR